MAVNHLGLRAGVDQVYCATLFGDMLSGVYVGPTPSGKGVAVQLGEAGVRFYWPDRYTFIDPADALNYDRDAEDDQDDALHAPWGLMGHGAY